MSGINKLAKKIWENQASEYVVVAVILLNAVVLGLSTYFSPNTGVGKLLLTIDQACLAFFVVELCSKIYVYRSKFVKDPWHIFDFIVVGIGLVPAYGPYIIFRAFRIFRVLRILTVFPSLRTVVHSIITSIPGMVGVLFLTLIIYYVYAVLGVELFRSEYPQFFGDLSRAFLTLFQLMTLENWPDVAYTVMKSHPFSWLFFVSFIIITALAVLNLIVGLLVNAIQEERDEEKQEFHKQILKSTEAILLAEITDLRKEIKKLSIPKK
jgi:voltage-gated sodium channel